MIGYIGSVYPIHSDYEVGVCDREIGMMIGMEGGLVIIEEDRWMAEWNDVNELNGRRNSVKDVNRCRLQVRTKQSMGYENDKITIFVELKDKKEYY